MSLTAPLPVGKHQRAAANEAIGYAIQNAFASFGVPVVYAENDMGFQLGLVYDLRGKQTVARISMPWPE